MDLCLLQITERNKNKKIFLFNKQFFYRKRIFPKKLLWFNRSTSRGFIELEMLIWTVVITALLGGFFRIHNSYKTQHLKLQKDFQNEWNNL